MGTIVALKVYARLPERIKSLTIIGGLPEPIAPIRQKLNERIGRVSSVGMSGITEEIVLGIFAAISLDRKAQMVRTVMRLIEMNSAESYIRSLRELIESSATAVVETVKIPCLAITGTEDRYASPEDVRAFADSISSEVEIEVFSGCGHMIMYEAPDLLYGSVNTFLESLDCD